MKKITLTEIAEVFCYIAAVTVVIMALVAVVAIVVYGWRINTILSGSMYPTIPVGALVISKPISDLHVGQIIVFKSGNVQTCHRVIALENGQITTKGDANDNVDPGQITTANVNGEYVANVPLLGYIMVYAKSTLGIVLFVIDPAILFIGYTVWDASRYVLGNEEAIYAEDDYSERYAEEIAELKALICEGLEPYCYTDDDYVDKYAWEMAGIKELICEGLES